MAAWLSSKQTKIRSLTYGLLPFAVLVGFVAGLIILEPKISTAILILVTASIMFFLAGADWVQLIITGIVFGSASFIAATQIDYARQRVQSFIDLLRNPLLEREDGEAGEPEPEPVESHPDAGAYEDTVDHGDRIQSAGQIASVVLGDDAVAEGEWSPGDDAGRGSSVQVLEPVAGNRAVVDRH